LEARAVSALVLGGAVGVRQRAGFDLTAIGGDREIDDGGVLGLAGTMSTLNLPLFVSSF
jgi:hypothetical protein